MNSDIESEFFGGAHSPTKPSRLFLSLESRRCEALDFEVESAFPVDGVFPIKRCDSSLLFKREEARVPSRDDVIKSSVGVREPGGELEQGRVT